jgi:hypothetical protein
MLWCTRQQATALFLAASLLAACGGGAGSGSNHTTFPVVPAGPATSELGNLDGPEGLTFDAAGNLYAGSQSGRITRISPDFTVSVFAETHKQLAGLATGPQDEIYAAAFATGEVLAISQGGVTRVATSGLDSPNAIVFDRNQRAIVSATGLGGFPQIAAIEPDATYHTLSLKVTSPNGMAFDENNFLYVADTFMNRVVRLQMNDVGELGEPEVYATGTALADGIALDNQDNLYVAGNGKIVVVINNNERALEDYVTQGDVNGPASLAFGFGQGRDTRQLYFTNYGFPALGTGMDVASVFVNIPGRRLFAP